VVIISGIFDSALSLLNADTCQPRRQRRRRSRVMIWRITGERLYGPSPNTTDINKNQSEDRHSSCKSHNSSRFCVLTSRVKPKLSQVWYGTGLVEMGEDIRKCTSRADPGNHRKPCPSMELSPSLRNVLVWMIDAEFQTTSFD